MKSKKRINYKVIAYSLIALLCLWFAFKYDWLWIIPAVVLVWMNQRELNKA